jgi:hypothetical protein
MVMVPLSSDADFEKLVHLKRLLKLFGGDFEFTVSFVNFLHCIRFSYVFLHRTCAFRIIFWSDAFSKSDV